MGSRPGSQLSVARQDETREAQRFLAGLDDPIATLARDHGLVEAALPSHGVVLGDHLARLTLSIVGQQISVKAALAIFGRLSELLGGNISADALAAADDDELRAVGLSRAKARALRELGIQVSTGRFDFAELEALSDEDAEARLVSLRGIGPWSAQNVSAALDGPPGRVSGRGHRSEARHRDARPA